MKNKSNSKHDVNVVYTTDGRVFRERSVPCHGFIDNPLDRIKGKDKSNYIVRYKNVSFKADDEVNINKMIKKGFVPEEVSSIDGSEHYYLRGTTV